MQWGGGGSVLFDFLIFAYHFLLVPVKSLRHAFYMKILSWRSSGIFPPCKNGRKLYFGCLFLYYKIGLKIILII